MRGSIVIALSVALLIAASGVVSAQAKGDAGASVEAREAARAAYARGQSAFAEGRYEEALEAFEAAFAAVPNPIVLLGISEAQAKQGAIEAAIATIERYLALRPDAPDRADVEAKKAALARTPAKLAVRSKPEGAELTVDGELVSQKTPAELELAPGEHEIQYTLPGHRGGTELIELPPGGTGELSLMLEPLGPEPALAQAAASVQGLEESPEETAVVSEPAPVAATSAREPPTTALWVTGGIGAASIVAGTVLGFLALQERSDYNARPSEASADRGERLALFADVAFGVGAMAFITAAVLYLTQDEPAPSAEPSAQRTPQEGHATLELTPLFSPTTASATARVRF